MVCVVSGYANLHKTHVNRPGYNICDPNAIESKGFDINCSLVCTLKQPFISGMTSFFTYREDCNGDLINTRLLSPNMFYISIGCPSNYNEDSLNNNTWTGTANYTTSHGVISGEIAGYRLKIDVTMTAVAVGLLSVTITTRRLMPGSLNYVTCNSISMEMTETAASAASDGYDARYYESELLDTSFDIDACGGEVKKVRATVALLSYHFGCSITYTPGASKCNLRTRRSGVIREYSCLVGLASPADGTSWLPQVVQLGVNTVNCNVTGQCGCYYWDGYGFTPTRNGSSDLAFLGCPNELPQKVQRIQRAILGTSSYGAYEVILKTIEADPICIAARLYNPFSPGPWIIGSLTVVQTVNPFIMQASFPELAGSPVFQFYGMEFPTSIIQDCIDAPAPAPMMAMRSMSFEEPALQIEDNTPAPAPAPTPTTENSNMAQAREIIKKIYQVKASPCVNLGMALEETASCGCGGAVLHECSIYGQCRQSGNDDKTQLCWKCSDYSAS